MPPTLEHFSNITLLKELPDNARRELEGAAVQKRLSRREVVFNKGESLKFFPLLLDGRLQGIDFTIDGREVGLYFVGPGEFFGELSLIDRNPMAETVIALAPSLVLMLPKEKTRNLMFSTPDLAEKVALRMAARVRGEARQRLLLALQNPMQRLCAQLLDLAAPGGSALPGNDVAEIPCIPTHQEIAIMINSSRETVTRAFQQLQNQGIVKRDGNRLLIADAQMLHALATGSGN